MNEIEINGSTVAVKEWKGQRVVTFRDIDTVHERPDGTAKRNFRANKEHFIENEDYFIAEITKDEIRPQFGISKNAGRTIIFLTESGYLMLVKSFTDKLAWQVQRELVNGYFRAKEVDYSALSPQLQFLIQLEKKQNRLERRIDSMCETMQVRGTNWRRATHSLINRIASASGIEQRELYIVIYDELECRAGVDLDRRLTNLQDRLYDRGVSESRISRLNYIDIIAEDRKLIEIYIAIVKETAIKYNAE